MARHDVRLEVIVYVGERVTDPQRPRCLHHHAVFDRPQAHAAAWRGDQLVNAWCYSHYVHGQKPPEAVETAPPP